MTVNFVDDKLEAYGGNTPTNTMAGKFLNKGNGQLEFVDFTIISRVAETPWGDAFSTRILRPHQPRRRPAERMTSPNS